MRVHAATAWAARSDTGLPKDELVDVEVVHVDLPTDRPSGARFGSLVHSLLAVVPLDASAEAVLPIAEVHGRILGATPTEIAAAPRVVERILAHPLMSRARAASRAGALQREVPVLLRTESGELVDGVVDLLFEEDGGAVLVDFKTDAVPGTNLTRYSRQMQAYAVAVQRVKGTEVRAVLLSAT
jgi:ATP-dependent helicase/nuclease subunit A